MLLLLDDGTARLLDFGGKFHALPDIAAVMLTETLRAGPKAAVARIASEFEAAPAAVAADVAALLARLVATGAIRQPGLTKPRRRIGAAALAGCLPMAVRRGSITMLALAFLSLRLFGWPRTVAAWQRRLGGTAAPTSSLSVETVDAAIRRGAARHALNITCKERALAGWAMLRAAGLPAIVVVGVDLYPLASHAWCESDSRVVGDDPERCSRFTPVLRHG